MAELQFAEIDRTVNFRPPSGEPLAARLVDFGFQTADDGSVNVEVVVGLDREAYGRVDREHLFHLLPEVRGPGSAGFEPQAGVRIELRLKSMLVPQLYGLTHDPQAAGHRVVERSEEGGSVLLETESWYAQSVMADVPLPEGLEGELRMGYRTAWTADDDLFGVDPAGAVDEQVSLSLPMLAVIEEVLDQRGWEYRQIPHRGALGWKVRSEYGAWECYAIVDEQPGLLLLYSILDAIVPPERREKAALLIARLNQGLPVGNWELDVDSGSLRYKTSLDVGAEALGTALFERLLERSLDIVAAHQPALEGFAAGRLELEAALALTGEV